MDPKTAHVMRAATHQRQLGLPRLEVPPTLPLEDGHLGRAPDRMVAARSACHPVRSGKERSGLL